MAFILKMKNGKPFTKELLLKSNKLRTHLDFLLTSGSVDNFLPTQTFTEFINSLTPDTEIPELKIEGSDEVTSTQYLTNTYFVTHNYGTGVAEDQYFFQFKLGIDGNKMQDEYGYDIISLKSMVNDKTLTLKDLFKYDSNLNIITNNNIYDTLFYKILLLSAHPFTEDRITDGVRPTIKQLATNYINRHDFLYSVNNSIKDTNFFIDNKIKYLGTKLYDEIKSIRFSLDDGTLDNEKQFISNDYSSANINLCGVIINNRSMYHFRDFNNSLFLEAKLEDYRHLALDEILLLIHNNILTEGNIFKFINNDYKVDNNINYADDRIIYKVTQNYLKTQDSNCTMELIDGKLIFKLSTTGPKFLSLYNKIEGTELPDITSIDYAIENIINKNSGYVLNLEIYPSDDISIKEEFNRFSLDALRSVEEIFERKNGNLVNIYSAQFMKIEDTKFYKNFTQIKNTNAMIPIEQL